MIAARVLTAISAVILLAVSALHMTGSTMVVTAVEGASFSEFLTGALPVVWWHFSWHLFLIALPLLWAALKTPSWFLSATLFICIIVITDFLWVFSIAGWFPGTIMLAMAVCVWLCHLIWPENSRLILFFADL